MRVLPRFLLLAAFTVAPAAAGAQEVDLSEYPATAVDELSERHRAWLEQEVVWIITTEERDVFLRLGSEARRDDFIERFWAVRDPSPGTERNEYRELHYQRLEDAESKLNLLSTRPVWQTDMGRIYTLLGEPQSRSRLPNTSDAVPIEVWFYNVDPAYGTPPFFYLIFFKDRGVGDYRLYSPAIDGPKSLLNAAAQVELGRGGGSGQITPGQTSFAFGENERAIEMLRQVDPELGNAAASLVPGESAGAMVSPLRSEMVLSRVFEIPKRLMPRPIWAYRALTGETEAEVRFETLPMMAAAHVLFDPSGLPFVHYSARAPGDSLNLNNYEDEYYVTFDVSTAVRDAELRTLTARSPRTLQADVDEESARRLRGGPFQYVERMPVLPGDYSLDLILENNLSRRFGRASFALHVPDLRGDRVDAVAPVLALETAALDDYDPFAEQFPYQVGDRLLIPTAGGPVPSDREITLYWQVYVPVGRSEPVEIAYRVRDARGGLGLERIIRVAPESRSELGLVDVRTLVDLQGFPPGDYTLVATIEGESTLRYEMSLPVVAPAAYVRPFVHALRQPPASGVAVSVERAGQMRTVGQTDRAIAILADVLRRDPDHAEAFDLQVELLTDAGRFAELAELLRPRLVAAPNDAELLVLMGGAQAELGEHYDAIRYYERARLAGRPDDPELLNALASEYYAEGDLERTRGLLEASLALDPEQPQIRRLLEEVVGPGPAEGG